MWNMLNHVCRFWWWLYCYLTVVCDWHRQGNCVAACCPHDFIHILLLAEVTALRPWCVASSSNQLEFIGHLAFYVSFHFCNWIWTIGFGQFGLIWMIGSGTFYGNFGDWLEDSLFVPLHSICSFLNLTVEFVFIFGQNGEQLAHYANMCVSLTAL